ncbi:MAG TPA: glycosyltransferase family 4 protein [Vicinamibacterales bacterium]|nr:glycosyltransferase family 4 protein [Vicinamibacterales bacterium]
MPAHPERRTPHVLIAVNVDWYFWSHRIPLARALRAAGYDVTVVAGEERGFRPRIEAAGFRFVPLRLRRGSTNPLRELGTLVDLVRIYRRERPDVVHHVSIKPILYGSIAARFAGGPAIINAVTGLGHAFLPEVRRSLLGRLTARLYRLACAGPRTLVLCQNPEDRAALIALGAVPPDRTVLIRGSGVDMAAFSPSPEPSGVPVLLLCGRMLWDKGVGEFVDAARILKEAGVAHRAVVVGIPDEENPNSVPVASLEAWQRAGVIEWWGLREDMPTVFARSTIVVLPSYYPEGVPKVLIEAAAAGRPIVTTDLPGCREIGRPGINADLVRPRDSIHLAAALQALLADPTRRAAYGAAGRRIAESEFSDTQVIAETLAVYTRLLSSSPPNRQ